MKFNVVDLQDVRVTDVPREVKFEMQRLRRNDPTGWSIYQLARHYELPEPVVREIVDLVPNA